MSLCRKRNHLVSVPAIDVLVWGLCGHGCDRKKREHPVELCSQLACGLLSVFSDERSATYPVAGWSSEPELRGTRRHYDHAEASQHSNSRQWRLRNDADPELMAASALGCQLMLLIEWRKPKSAIPLLHIPSRSHSQENLKTRISHGISHSYPGISSALVVPLSYQSLGCAHLQAL